MLRPYRRNLSRVIGVIALLLSLFLALSLLESYNPSATLTSTSEEVANISEGRLKRILLTVHILEEESFRYRSVPDVLVEVRRLGGLDNFSEDVDANVISARTDRQGYIYFALPEGRYEVSVEHFGLRVNSTIKLYEPYVGFTTFIFHQKMVEPLLIHLYDTLDQNGIIEESDKIDVWYRSDPWFKLDVVNLFSEDGESIYMKPLSLNRSGNLYHISLAPISTLDVRVFDEMKSVDLGLRWVTVEISLTNWRAVSLVYP